MLIIIAELEDALNRPTKLEFGSKTYPILAVAFTTAIKLTLFVIKICKCCEGSSESRKIC